jgi:hypothetical protein
MGTGHAVTGGLRLSRMTSGSRSERTAPQDKEPYKDKDGTVEACKSSLADAT